MCIVTRVASSKTVGPACLALFCLASGAATSPAEALKGILYGIHQGQGRNPGGHVRLAVGERVHKLEYVPRAVRFSHETCYEPGAIWTTTIMKIDVSRVVERPICNGSVDEITHGAWKVVRDYLEGLVGRRSPPHPGTFSTRWRSSPEFAPFEARIKSVDLDAYRSLGFYGRCLDILGIERFKRARIGASDCFIGGNYGVLVFHLIWSVQAKKWEIDVIQFQDSQQYWRAMQ